MLRNMLRSIRARTKAIDPVAPAGSHTAFPPMCVANDLAIIGDVHGMLRPFERTLRRLENEHPGARVICVGDLIDRGDDSVEVLQLAYARRDRMMVLMGNHEEMMLRFLLNPIQEAGRWLINGGLQTLASFRVRPPGSSASPAELQTVSNRLRDAIGPELETWLKGLPRYHMDGNIAVTHAGADPWLPMAQQTDRNLTWGHPDFGRRRRTDGIWIAHGHTIVAEPKAAEGVISVDTGAYAGGGLTSAVITGAGACFLTERP